MLEFKDLYNSYADDVYRFAFWLSGDRFEAEDITSETFMRAWANNSKIQTETLKAYLLTIVRNIFLQHLRKKKNQVILEDTYPDPAPTPDRQLESKLELQAVRRILQTLPETDRAAFILRVEHELPYAEIARVLGMSCSNAKVKIHRVRKRLIAARLDEEV